VLRVGNRALLRRYYEKAFEDFQQLNCRAIAKSYVKLVEPRKQVHFPYNGRRSIAGVTQTDNPEHTKPGWWPAGVLHKEPDHLLKPGEYAKWCFEGFADYDRSLATSRPYSLRVER
jgi:hypothetical protein